VRSMMDDANFTQGATYTVHLKRSYGFGQGVRGYGLQFEPRAEGPMVTKVFENGEAHRSGLIETGDVLVEVNGESIAGEEFLQVMDRIVSTDSCSFTFKGSS